MQSTIFVDVSSNSAKFSSQSNPYHRAVSNTNRPAHSRLISSQDDESRIRLDAQRLLDCASEVCEKHLYHSDIKQAFMADVENFANEIVDQVESGTMSYAEGSKQIKEEEKSLGEQSYEWITRGLTVLGGFGLIAAGAAMCTTGLGCFVGAYLAAHGANDIQEGVSGEQNGFLRHAYREGAKQLGMSESVGSIVYDVADLGLSVHGKLKLVPKIDKSFALNEFNKNHTQVFKLFSYGRKDLTRAFNQMSKKLLTAGIFGDTLILLNITKNILVKDEETGDTTLFVQEPENITNVEQIIDNCMPVIVITGNDETQNNFYYRCTRPDGQQYIDYGDGRVEELE